MDQFQCERCNKAYRWKPELGGRKVRCKCGHVVRVPEADAAPTIKLAAEEPEKPKRHAGGGSRCPGCGSAMAEGSVLCVGCGYNLRTGEQVGFRGVQSEGQVTERTGRGDAGSPRETARRFRMAAAAGAAAAVLGGAIWTGVFMMLGGTGLPLGWLAVGVGLLTGAAVRQFAEQRSERLGAMAGGWALCGVVVAHALMYQAIPYLTTERLLEQPGAYIPAVIWHMAPSEGRQDLADAVVDQLAEALVRNAGVPRRHWTAPSLRLPDRDAEAWQNIAERAAERGAAMEHSELAGIVRRWQTAAMSRVSYRDRFRFITSLMSFYDWLWIIMAFAVAHGLGRGSES